MGTRPASTKDRILDAAECLFAERGFRGTSLRDITAAAQVNLAAVNYHFQTKDALTVAVLSRRIRPMNEKRLAMLSECEERAGKGPLPLECVLRAFVEPLIWLRQELPDGAAAVRLLGQMFTEPGEVFQQLFELEFGETVRRFIIAIRRALPQLPEEDLFWRFYFLLGSLVHVITGGERMNVISKGRYDASDVHAIHERLLAFAEAGFRAPGRIEPKGGRRCRK